MESHRKMPLDIAIEELKACGVNGIYFGDAYASNDEIKILNNHACDEIMLKFIPKSDELDLDYIYEIFYSILTVYGCQH